MQPETCRTLHQESVLTMYTLWSCRQGETGSRKMNRNISVFYAHPLERYLRFSFQLQGSSLILSTMNWFNTKHERLKHKNTGFLRWNIILRLTFWYDAKAGEKIWQVGNMKFKFITEFENTRIRNWILFCWLLKRYFKTSILKQNDLFMKKSTKTDVNKWSISVLLLYLI